MLVRRKSACKTSAGSSKILRWLTPLLGPNLDPKTGPKQRPKRRNENVIQFWTPFWGPYLDPKMGSAIGEFRCCPHMLCKQICDPAAWTWMSTHTFFSLWVPSPVATVQETKWDAQREKACINTYAHASASQICLQNLCGQQQNSPMADRSSIKLQTLTLDRYPKTKDGPKTHHVSKLIIFERILRGGKFKSGWIVTSPCDFC